VPPVEGTARLQPGAANRTWPLRNWKRRLVVRGRERGGGGGSAPIDENFQNPFVAGEVGHVIAESGRGGNEGRRCNGWQGA
jgi:hypothetical protein